MKQSILFIVINGDGLGHLTRALAVARRLSKFSDFDVIFYTTSIAWELVKNFGFPCYYIPARERMREDVSMRDWESKIQLKLEDIIKTHRPGIAVFDGAYPSTAILAPLMKIDWIKKLWIKREGDRPNMSGFEIYDKFFDNIVVPTEVGLSYQDTPSRKWYCSPILMLDGTQGYERTQVRELYHVNEEDCFWYVQLGNEETYDKKEKVDFVIKQLLQNKRNVILLGESISGTPQNIRDERVITIRDYPNSRLFKGIDCAVSAAGYNTFHELLSFKIPSIFIPNLRVLKDNQAARAKRAEDLGIGIALTDTFHFFEALTNFEKLVEEFRNNLEKIEFMNGAMQVADYIVKQIEVN